MRDDKHLLSDEQIRAFITDGYVQVQTDLDDSVHRTIFEKTDRVLGPATMGRRAAAAIRRTTSCRWWASWPRCWRRRKWSAR